jgi:uncharacterized protein YeeX (DUF496 family)
LFMAYYNKTFVLLRSNTISNGKDMITRKIRGSPKRIWNVMNLLENLKTNANERRM